MFHPREKMPSKQLKIQTGDTKKNPGGEAPPKMLGTTKKYPGGMITFHPRKNAIHTIETPTKGHDAREKIPGGTRLRKWRNPCFSRGIRSVVRRGPSEPSAVERAPFDAPRSPSLALGGVFSPMTPCAAVWGGRGAAAGAPVAPGRAVPKRGILKPA